MEDHELVLADCFESAKPVELNSIEKQKSNLILSNENIIDVTKTVLEEATDWLPLFSEIYNISSNLKDFILIPCVIMPSDLPNRNAQGFPFQELIRADSETGLIGYETWRRKCTFRDHSNKDPSQAKGIIFSSSLKPMKQTKGNIHKVIALMGFDRSRDPILCNDILTGVRPSFSMGAWARYFTCSLCNSKHTSKERGCEHISVSMPRMQKINNKLVYLQARYMTGFEVSSVSKPAYYSATTPKEMYL